MNWLQKLLAPRKRTEMDRWPEIVAEHSTNLRKGDATQYVLTETSLGNPMTLRVSTPQHCVYCERFSDPEFRDRAFPRGGGYCGAWNGAVGIDDSCKHWSPSTSVRWWLSKGYMASKGISTPYQLFDDGADGARGAR